MKRADGALGRTPLRIDLLGPFRVAMGSRELAASELGSRKGRALLKLLVAERGHLVPTDRIAEELWPGEPPARPSANVAVLVSRLRSVLGPDLIQGGRSGYLFRPGPDCWVDLDSASDLVAEARRGLAAGDLVSAGTSAMAALALLERGEVLEGEPYSDWLEAARTAARRSLRAARLVAWTVALQRGSLGDAVEHAEKAIRADELDEEAHRARILGLYLNGQAPLALQAYERLHAALEHELGAAPSHESESLYRRVLRGDDLSAEGSRVASAAIASPNWEAAGRADELQRLDAAWDEAEAAGAGLALVSGEPGIGKSHLAAAFAARVERTGGLVLRAHCYEIEHSLFLQPFGDALRPAILGGAATEALNSLGADGASSLADLLPELRALVSIPTGRASSDAALERLRAFNALSALLEGLSRQHRLLLVLDDLHAAGESTIEFVHWLLRRGRRTRCLVIGLVRSEEEKSIAPLLELATRIPLAGLPPGAIARLAESSGLGHMAEEVMRLSGGHPFYAIETLRAIRETGAPAISDSLRDTVLERVKRAGDEIERFLRAAAVTGPIVDLDVVGEAVEADPVRAAWLGESALRRGLLVAAGRHYHFAHAIVREVVYESTPAPTRTAWHRRVATILQRRGAAAETVAYHAREAGDRRLAARAFLAAARSAAAAFANREAERLAGQAVLAASGLDDDTLEAEARFERGKARVVLEDHPRASEDLVAALKLARAAGERSLELAALEQLGWNAHFARDLSSAARYSAQALASAVTPGTLSLAARVDHALGRLRDAEDESTRAVDLGRESDDLAATGVGLSYLGAVKAHMDLYAEAIPLLEDAETASRDAGQLHPAMNAVFFRGLAIGNQGDLKQALDLFERLDRECGELEYPHHVARALNGMAWVWLELGDEGRTLELATRAATLCSSQAMDEPHANALLLQADARLRRGDHDRASDLLAAARPLGLAASYAWRFELRVLELSARLSAAAGADTRRQAARLAKLARARGAPKYEALGLGHAGRRRAAAAIARRLGSDLLILKVGPTREAADAAARIAGRLPEDLTRSFRRSWLPAIEAREPVGPS